MKTSAAKYQILITVDPKRVRPFAQQPREYFDPEKLASLEASIKHRGQLQPGMVREISDPKHDFEIVDGQRRWHACLRLGIPFRAVVVETVDIEEQFEISVAANFQRTEHTALEEARAIERLCTQGGRSEQYVADLFGRHVTTINKTRRLIDLAPDLQKLIDPEKTPRDKMLPLLAAFELARLSKQRQLDLLPKVRKMSALRVISLVRKELLQTGVITNRAVKARTNDRVLRRYLDSTIDKAEFLLGRLNREESGKLVSRLRTSKTFNEVNTAIDSAIHRLEEIRNRLAGAVPTPPAPITRAAVPPAPKKSAITPPPGKSADRSVVYSHLVRCSKCGARETRFRRAVNANPQTDFWMCVATGCLVAIRFVKIPVDTKYRPKGAA